MNALTEEGLENYRPGGWEIWERKIMGLTDSTYHAFQVMTRSKGLFWGYRRNLKTLLNETI